MRRLVEDVQHAHQPAADLRRQPDALRLAARERRGGAVEREVVQPDVQQEPQPRADLLDDLLGDDRLALGQRAASSNQSYAALTDIVRDLAICSARRS